MPIAVEMFLDDASASVVRDIWKDLHDSRVTSFLWKSGARPHITLGIYEGIEYPEFASKLEAFAGDLTPISVVLESIGIFPTDKSVVFLAPHISKHLLSLKTTFHDLFRDVGEFSWEFYLPEHWIPHITLAMELTKDAVPKAVEVCMRHPMRIHGRIEEIGLVKFPPIETMRSFKLG